MMPLINVKFARGNSCHKIGPATFDILVTHGETPVVTITQPEVITLLHQDGKLSLIRLVFDGHIKRHEMGA